MFLGFKSSKREELPRGIAIHAVQQPRGVATTQADLKTHRDVSKPSGLSIAKRPVGAEPRRVDFSMPRMELRRRISVSS